MYASPVMIVNAAGIHARPASELVNYCKQAGANGFPAR